MIILIYQREFIILNNFKYIFRQNANNSNFNPISRTINNMKAMLLRNILEDREVELIILNRPPTRSFTHNCDFGARVGVQHFQRLRFKGQYFRKLDS